MRLSIVTVCKNASQELGRTLKSVSEQSYQDFEYIVIDGGSDSATLQLLNNCRRIDQLISEPDTGIYNAMNKALQLCKGEYIMFMNAGDTFVDADTLASAVSQFDNHDVVYGDHIVKYTNGRTIRHSAGSPTELWRGSRWCHQAMFVRRSIHRLFNEDYTLAADFDLICDLSTRGATFRHLPLYICIYQAGGYSDGNPEVIKQWCQIAAHYFPEKFRNSYYQRLLAATKFKRCIKNLIFNR